jgi:alpha-beta hydrolase superfamily lysophospholipase
MEDVSVKIYPLCRHEILNEINRAEIFEDLGAWIESKL